MRKPATAAPGGPETNANPRHKLGHLEKFVLLDCEVRFWGERRVLRVLLGVRCQGSSWIALAKGCLRRRSAPARWSCILSPGYAGVAVRSRKANRLMLYTRFISPIFALARTRPIVRTIFPPMLVC